MIRRSPLFALLCVSFLLNLGSAQATTYIVFRYDDLAGDLPGVRATNALRRQIWEAEQALDRSFEKHGLSYVAAIIPSVAQGYAGGPAAKAASFSEDREKLEFVRRGVEAGRIEVAQHGFAHVNHVWETRRSHRQGEFRERSYRSQLEDILAGQRILRDDCGFKRVETFVAPWHGWDANTVLALKEAGFRIFSDRIFDYCREADAFWLVPETAGLADLESLVDANAMPAAGTMVVLYHPGDIAPATGAGNDSFGVSRFDTLLARLAGLPQVRVLTLQQLVEREGSLTAGRFRAAVKCRQWYDFLADAVPRRFLPGASSALFYLSEAEYSKAANDCVLIAALILLVVFTLGLWAGGLAIKYAGIQRPWWVFGVALAVVLLALASQWHLLYKGYHLQIKRAVPACAAAGFASMVVFRTRRAATGPQLGDA